MTSNQEPEPEPGAAGARLGPEVWLDILKTLALKSVAQELQGRRVELGGFKNSKSKSDRIRAQVDELGQLLVA